MKKDNKKILVVSDLDGTFLDSESVPHLRNLKAIEELKKAGHYFTIATGRFDAVWAKYANAPVILCNGAFMYDPSTLSVINEHLTDSAPIYEILKEIHKKFPAPKIRYTDRGGVHFLFENGAEENISGFWYKVVFESSLQDPRSATAELAAVKDFLVEKYGDRFNYNFSSPWLFEALQPGVTKGAAIAELRRYFADRGEDVIIYAAGDYENDVEMLRSADIAVCPCSALPSVKEEVEKTGGLVVCENDAGTIADLIERAAKIYTADSPEKSGFSQARLGLIKEHNQARISSGKLSSAAVIAARAGWTVYCERFGCSDVENKISLGRGAIFRLASMTKPIVAAAVMIQRDRGKLNVCDAVEKYIPSFKNMKIGRLRDGKPEVIGKAEKPVRIFDLLTHSGGLGSGAIGEFEYGRTAPGEGETLADAVSRFGATLLEFEPGTATLYSGLMAFDTLAHIVEITSGMSFADFLDENLFGPLGIFDITYRPTESQKKRVVEMYADSGHGLVHIDMGGHIFGNLPSSYYSGGGGLLGSLEDYFIFAEMLRGEGEYRGIRVMSAEAVKEMKSPQFPSQWAGLPEVWGLGMRVITGENGVLTKGSFGWSGAYGTHFWIDPEKEITAVYCSNMTTAGGAGAETAREFERDLMNAIL